MYAVELILMHVHFCCVQAAVAGKGNGKGRFNRRTSMFMV